MKYRNTKTQAVIDTACVIHGDNWEKVEKQPSTKENKKETKKKTKKDGE